LIQVDDIIKFDAGDFYGEIEGKVVSVKELENIIELMVYIQEYRTFSKININKDHFYARLFSSRKPDWEI
jgi:hypothetical protein